jgi:endo-1,4-beta-D-glucanase Y
MINTGLTLLEKFYDANGVPLKLEMEKEVVMKTQLEAQTILGETRSAVDNILEAMLIMRQSGILEKDVIDTNVEESQLYLHTPTIYPKFKKWARETSFEGEVISHSEFVKQISKMDYYIGYKAVRLEDATRKARVFDIPKLVAKKLYEE